MVCSPLTGLTTMSEVPWNTIVGIRRRGEPEQRQASLPRTFGSNELPLNSESAAVSMPMAPLYMPPECTITAANTSE